MLCIPVLKPLVPILLVMGGRGPSIINSTISKSMCKCVQVTSIMFVAVRSLEEDAEDVFTNRGSLSQGDAYPELTRNANQVSNVESPCLIIFMRCCSQSQKSVCPWDLGGGVCLAYSVTIFS